MWSLVGVIHELFGGVSVSFNERACRHRVHIHVNLRSREPLPGKFFNFFDSRFSLCWPIIRLVPKIRRASIGRPSNKSKDKLTGLSFGVQLTPCSASIGSGLGRDCPRPKLHLSVSIIAKSSPRTNLQTSQILTQLFSQLYIYVCLTDYMPSHSLPYQPFLQPFHFFYLPLGCQTVLLCFSLFDVAFEGF